MADKCCFCGKELPKYEYNNPEPLSETGLCCGKCDRELVWGTRRIVWRPFLDKKTQQEVTMLLRALPLDIIRQIVPEHPLGNSDDWQRYMDKLPDKIKKMQKERGAE